MAHSVSLSWAASTDPVSGYNVYRGAAAGAETTLLTPTPITALVFTDSSPVLGEDFYVVKSVLNGVDSVASNEVSTVILPAPPTNLVITASA
jgi:hypothetical protein